jgi:hypothetical protein
MKHRGDSTEWGSGRLSGKTESVVSIIMSKDIGEYNTCPHLCHYCYANTNNAAAMENWRRHCKCPHGETITGNTTVEARCA